MQRAFSAVRSLVSSARDAKGKLLLDLKDLIRAFCIQELIQPQLQDLQVSSIPAGACRMSERNVVTWRSPSTRTHPYMVICRGRLGLGHAPEAGGPQTRRREHLQDGDVSTA